MVSFTLVAVLRDRIAYVAYSNPDAAQQTELVVIDTSAPNNVTLLTPQALDKQPFGLIGTRSDTGQGGTMNLLRRTSCDGGAASCLELVHVTVPPLASDPPSIGAPILLNSFFGTAGFGSFDNGGSPRDVIATAAAAGANTITLTQYQPKVPGSALPPPITVGVLGQFLKPLAFAECMHMALIVETNQDLNVYAASLTNLNASATTAISTGHSGQGVYFEPTTSSVLTPFSQGENFELNAFALGGDQDKPTLLKRNDWAPPSNLRPQIIATRVPLPIVCP
jgi:hypothetical protein